MPLAIPLLTDFVDDPATAVDDVANAVHSSAFDLLDKVLGGLRTVGDTNPASPEFLRQYAAAAGIGLVLMAFMAILAIVHGMRNGAGRDDLRESLLKYLPLAAFLILFSPAAGVLVATTANAATEGIATWGAGSIDQVKQKLEALRGITADDLPGGTFVGLLVFGLLVICALGLFIVLAAQEIGLAAAGVVTGMAWGMLVHPRWRRAAWRAPGVWVGLVAAKPVLFLVLTALFGMVGGSGAAGGGVEGLTRLCLLAVAMLIACAVPVVLTRKAAGSGTGRQPAGHAQASATVLGGSRHEFGDRWISGSVTPVQVPTTPGGHLIEQAYERGQRDRGKPQARPSSHHLDEATPTESLEPSGKRRP